MQSGILGHPSLLYGDPEETRSLFATWLHGLGVDRTPKKGRLLAQNAPIRRAPPVYLWAPGSATGQKRNPSASFCTWQWPSELSWSPAHPSPLEPAPGYPWPAWSARAPRQARNKGQGQPNEPLSKTPARLRDPNGQSPPRKTRTGSRRGPHRGGEGSPKKSRDNANPHGMVGLGERTITWGLGIGKVRKIWQIRTKTLFSAHVVLRFLDDFVDFCGFRIFSARI